MQTITEMCMIYTDIAKYVTEGNLRKTLMPFHEYISNNKNKYWILTFTLHMIKQIILLTFYLGRQVNTVYMLDTFMKIVSFLSNHNHH